MFDAYVTHEDYDGETGLSMFVRQEMQPEDPRQSWDHLCRLICWHRKYSIGDIHNWRDPDDFEEEMKATPHLRLPIHLFDHSGLAMNTIGFHCPWDSGQVGWIMVETAKVRAEYGVKRISPQLRTRVEALMRAEVSEYHQYLSGDVWAVDIEDGGEIVDSCGGFYGSEYAIEAGREMLAGWIDDRRGEMKRARDAADMHAARTLEADRADLYGDAAIA